MKRLFCLLAVLILAFAACAPAQTSSAASKPEITVPVEVGDPASVTIVKSGFFGGDTEGEAAKAWLASVGETVVWNIVAPELAEGQSLADYLKTATGLEGAFVYADSPRTVLALASAGLIEPLDSYIKNDTVYASLPEEFSAAFGFSGSVWGIPAGGSYELPWVRAYLGSAFEGEDIEAISGSVTALRTALSQNKDNKRTSLYSVGATGFSDIFAAYGAELPEAGSPIGYSTEKAGVIDSMLLDGAAEALQALREMYAEGLINTDFTTNTYADLEAALEKGTVASAAVPLGGASLIAGPKLYGSKAENSFENWESATSLYTEKPLVGAKTAISVDVGGYVMLKGGKEPAESVKYLLSSLWGSEESWLKFSFGIAGYTRTESGITLEYVSDKQHTAYPVPGLCSTLPGLYDAADCICSFTDSVETSKAIAADRAVYYAQAIEDGFESGAFYIVHPLYFGVNSATLAANATAVEAAFAKLLADAITSQEITVQQALANYRSDMTACGGDEILEEANSALGLFSTQSYSQQ